MMIASINYYLYTLITVTVIVTSFISCDKVNKKLTYPPIVVRNNLMPQYKRATLAMYQLATKNVLCSLMKEDDKSASISFLSLDLNLDTLIISGDTNIYKMTFYEDNKNSRYKAFYVNQPITCIYPCGIVFIKNKLSSFNGCDASFGFFEGINDSLELDKNFKNKLTDKSKFSNTLNGAISEWR
jgi:hypothetical protein